MTFTSARVSEVIVIQRPDHSAADVHGADELRLSTDHVCIIERRPLVPAVGVRTE